MNFKEILEKTNLKYKYTKKYIEYAEFENETIAVVIKSKSNVFKIKRNDFFLIDNMLLPYIFILIDTKKNEKYIYKVKEPNNDIRYAFDYSEKDEIYFGKQVLQNKKSDNEIIEEIKKIGSE